MSMAGTCFKIHSAQHWHWKMIPIYTLHSTALHCTGSALQGERASRSGEGWLACFIRWSATVWHNESWVTIHGRVCLWHNALLSPYREVRGMGMFPQQTLLQAWGPTQRWISEWLDERTQMADPSLSSCRFSRPDGDSKSLFFRWCLLLRPMLRLMIGRKPDFLLIPDSF